MVQLTRYFAEPPFACRNFGSLQNPRQIDLAMRVVKKMNAGDASSTHRTGCRKLSNAPEKRFHTLTAMQYSPTSNRRIIQALLGCVNSEFAARAANSRIGRRISRVPTRIQKKFLTSQK